MTIAVLPLSEQVLARLQTIPNIEVFDAEFVDDEGQPVSPTLDADGRVHAHAVLYPNGGQGRATRQGGSVTNLDWGFQVTCVGGDRTRCLWVVDKVRAALDGLRIARADGRKSVLHEIADIGAVRRNEDISPPRFYQPLQYRTSL